MAHRHFLDLADFSADTLRALLDAAHARKAARAGLPTAMPDAESTVCISTISFSQPGDAGCQRQNRQKPMAQQATKQQLAAMMKTTIEP